MRNVANESPPAAHDRDRFTRAHRAALAELSRGLSPGEEALLLHRIITETGCSQRALVPLTGISQGTISKRLKLLRDPTLRYHVPTTSPEQDSRRRANRREEADFATWCADQAAAAGWIVVREFRAYLPNTARSKHVDLVLFASLDERQALHPLPRVAIELKTRITTPSELRTALQQVRDHHNLVRCPYRLVTAELAPHLQRHGAVRTVDEYLDELHTGWVSGFPQPPA